MPKYQVLSLDGGGVRGVLTVRLLQRLAELPELTNVFDSVNLIAGNSSGGLIALAMARARAGKVPTTEALAKIVDVFKDGQSVFGRKRWGSFGFILTNRYGSKNKEEALEEHLKNTKLSELGTSVLITTFDIYGDPIDVTRGATRDNTPDSAHRRWKAKIFHNFTRANLFQPVDTSSDRERLARDVALYSTAAPCFFPTADGYVDGGVYANNPSMCALAQLFDNRYHPMPKLPLRDIVMFSVGAGLNTVSVRKKNNRWGLLHWFLPISFEHPYFQHFNRTFVALVSDATVGVADYQCRQMLGDENYRRLQVPFESNVAFEIDATKRIDEILAIADKFDLDPYAEWLSRYWMPRKELVPVLSDVTSKHVLGTVELTVLMPIKSGFVDVFETHTYATRLRIVLRALHALRLAARESCAVRVFPDIVDLIGSIHAFHLSIIQSRQLLLTVTFDRPWEPYFRLVWSRLGALLDLILINCEGYEAHVSSLGYDKFIAWVRQRQVEAELFYAASSHTVDDLNYLRELERKVRVDPSTNLAATAAMLTPKSPAEVASQAAAKHRDEVVDQGLIALATFYKLRDLYRDSKDAEFLRAAVFATLSTLDLSRASKEQREASCREIEWFEQIVHSRNPRFLPSVVGQIGQPPEPDSVRTPEFAQMQGGIVDVLPKVVHGVLLLARIEKPKLAREFLGGTLVNKITYYKGEAYDGMFVTVALTFEGLKRLGLSEEELAAFPKEFREGMEARAGMLGDVRGNHPKHWQQPLLNWDAAASAEGPLNRVRLSTVDIVIQLRSAEPAQEVDDWERHPLRSRAQKLMGDPATTGIRVMSQQIMAHHRDKDTGRIREHFGFVDGISHPQPTAVPLGEFVLGYENDRGDMPFYDTYDARAVPGRTRGSWLDNGSFLVVRKLEQHVEVWDELKKTIAADITKQGVSLSKETGLAKLMGRTADGWPLTLLTTSATADSPSPLKIPNEFDYKDDRGLGCPLHAHVRRANPRTAGIPHISRRGMTYGPRAGAAKAERGIMFIAYNASIAEQFEVLQRWMTGGNSTGGFSGSADPFLRVPETDQDDVFLVPIQKDVPAQYDVLRITLPEQPLVSLKWGLYAFVPSRAALKKLAEQPLKDEGKRLATLFNGEQTIMALRNDEEWSTILEDSSAIHSGRTAAVFAAIREFHGGVYRTPGGTLVIVASHQAFETVLKAEQPPEKDPVYSVSEYGKRMATSIGEIYLGMDEGKKYRQLSTAPNAAISRVKMADAFTQAHAKAAACLRLVAPDPKGKPLQLSLEPIVDTTLGRLAEEYFGIPDTVLVRSGGRPDDSGTDQSVYCPYHTLAPSRFIFSSPRPRKAVTDAGSALGAALLRRIHELTEQKDREGVWPDELPEDGISRAVWNASMKPDGHGRSVINHDLFARMMVGVLEGFLPTVYGNVLKILHLWLTDGTFWRVQQDLLVTHLTGDKYHRATLAVLPAMRAAMQTRPVPDIIHRTATRSARLGDVEVDEGDRIVLSIASVVQELAEKGLDDVYPVFGGNRGETNPPTHACPGYEMGLGATLGILTAVLEAGEFAPTAPLVVEFSTARHRVHEPDVVTT